MLRYIERNPLRAGAVKRVQDWPWSSFHVRRTPRHELRPLLADLPIDRPANWTRLIERPQTEAEEQALQTHIARGRAFGEARWVQRIAGRLSLEHTLRSPGRQKGWRKRKEKVI